MQCIQIVIFVQCTTLRLLPLFYLLQVCGLMTVEGFLNVDRNNANVITLHQFTVV